MKSRVLSDSFGVNKTKIIQMTYHFVKKIVFFHIFIELTIFSLLYPVLYIFYIHVLFWFFYAWPKFPRKIVQWIIQYLYAPASTNHSAAFQPISELMTHRKILHSILTEGKWNWNFSWVSLSVTFLFTRAVKLYL